MCGIIGIVGERPVADRLIEGLRRLEYRGYDSAGIAVLHEGELQRRRAPGKLRELEAMRATLSRLIHACHGDDRPDCPILEDIAGDRRS